VEIERANELLKPGYLDGDFDPPNLAPDRESRIRLFPDRVGEGLLRHCHEEMTYLAGFLPELYAKEAS
jgi:hypothetical protein